MADLTIAEAAERMRHDYATTGGCRAEDILRVLGDPRKRVTMPMIDEQDRLHGLPDLLRDPNDELHLPGHL